MKLFLLPAFLCTLTTSCLTDQGSQGTNGPEAGVVPGWFKSAYRLSEQQRTRLRDEAGSAQQDGNREVCGALILPFDGNGSLDKKDPSVGTGLVGAPACGDVMKLQIKIDAGVPQNTQIRW